MLSLGLRLSVEVRAEDDFAERLFQEPYKSSIESAFHQFSASLVEAMDGELVIGDYRIDPICDRLSYYHDNGQWADDE